MIFPMRIHIIYSGYTWKQVKIIKQNRSRRGKSQYNAIVRRNSISQSTKSRTKPNNLPLVSPHDTETDDSHGNSDDENGSNNDSESDGNYSNDDNDKDYSNADNGSDKNVVNDNNKENLKEDDDICVDYEEETIGGDF